MSNTKFNILVLDGGGSKGVYTIGVLKELEQKFGDNLYKHFNLIYGTSTGSIIAALLAIGTSVNDIEKMYFELIPKIMCGCSKTEKSENLKNEADKIFGNRKFDSFFTDIGIVAFNYDYQLPLIFKSNIMQAHGMKHSFDPGFGCTISESIQCSCSAYPIFDIKKIVTANKGPLNVIDGGFIANNAVLFALIDAYNAFKVPEQDIRLLSVGVGKYVEKSISWKFKILHKFNITKFIERVLSANTNTNVKLAELLFPNLKSVRISEVFNEPEYGTNMIESDVEKLKKLHQLGRNSFAKFEKNIDDLFKV
jgi:patatin-like phospholipase/acyl hydrolase